MSSPSCLFDKVRDFAGQRPEQAALIRGPEQITYSELVDRALRVCNGLLALQLDRQSRIAILCGNRCEFFEIWQGTSMAGHVLAPINARLAPPEITYILNDSKAQVLFIDEAFHHVAQEIAGDLLNIKKIITLGNPPPLTTDWLSYREWRQGFPADKLLPSLCSPPDPHDTVVQMYTSGTTGFPKGVELGHRSVLACVRSMMGETAWSPGEVTLVTAPLFHTAGCAWAHCALQSGGSIVLLEELSPAAVLSAIENHRVSQALLVPALIRTVLDYPQSARTNFSTLRRILYGASVIPVTTLRQALQTFKCAFEQGYGLTETVGPVAMLRPQDHDDGGKLQSCGKAVPGMALRVVDNDGNDCNTGEVGEIITSGPQLMKAYWNCPQDTREVIRDDWLYTGDAGYFDEDGYLYIHDRIKDMIVSGGENVYPAEVENVLMAYGGVADVAVIGVPDERWGEAVKALIVPQPGSEIRPAEIIAHARQQMADFKCPKSIDFVDSIPRNPSGKILKKLLREPYWAGYDRRVS